MIELIGSPFDGCGRRTGSRLGPAALRMAGMPEALARLDEVMDSGDTIPLDTHPLPGWAETAQLAIRAYQALAPRVEASIRAGHIPLMMGGDHSLSMGSLAGALRATEGDLAVVWIDAHMDLNTPATSPSGNLHGMPLAAALRMVDDAPNPHIPDARRADLDIVWQQILTTVMPEYTPKAVAWIGLRDVDPGEAANLMNIPQARAITMQEIDDKSIGNVMDELEGWLAARNVKNVWLSFDVDALDPIYAPGTGTAVRGGLTYREGHLVAERFCRQFASSGNPYRLVGLDLVEVNPLADMNNETAAVAVEWACSLFGRTVLHQYKGDAAP